MISADYVVQQLCRMMGNSRGMYGIEWSLDRECGYRAIVNGVGLYLTEYQGRDPRIYLFLFKDGAKTQIVEPAMPLSYAPIGKFLRTVLGTDLWAKMPGTPGEEDEEANERLRIALNKLHSRACEQDDLRAVGVQLNKDLREAIAKGVFRENFFDLSQARANEETRQQLFRKLLHLESVAQ